MQYVSARKPSSAHTPPKCTAYCPICYLALTNNFELHSNVPKQIQCNTSISSMKYIFFLYQAGGDFEILTNAEMILSRNNDMQVMSIKINDNNLYDGGTDRTFSITLNILESDFENVDVTSDSVLVTIADNEPSPPSSKLYVHVCVCVCVCV